MKTRITGPTVGELMSIEPVTIADTETVAEAERLMIDREVTGLPVVDRVGRLIGVLSQTDIVRAHASGQSLANWPGLAVRHLMTAPALTIRLDETLLTAARMMEQYHVHRLVVVAPDGEHAIGVISTTDLVRALVEILEELDDH
ncbi:MAG: CBS domain-containing protein [Chloroflexota bacterium]|nr:CBS domain-containing protein [Chloroflexota bacterium]